MKTNILLVLFCFSLSFVFSGCSSNIKGNVGKMENYRVPGLEPEWIINGEPIVYEGELWYPQDMYDILLDSEVYLLGEYKGVHFFVQKIDVKPYNRLYTKFGRNKFRIFKKQNKSGHDKNKKSF